MREIRVHYGAGYCAAAGWENYDASPTLFLERLPLIGGLMRINPQRFPDALKVGDIVKGLPVAPGSAMCVYSSHVLEHLSHDDCWTALRNTYAMMAPGGVFRMIVPDLKARAARYLALAQAGDPKAASNFMRETYLGSETRPRNLLQMVRGVLGNSRHLWMWDEPAMKHALESTGFIDVRRCQLGDARDEAFKAVEDAGRFQDSSTGDVEVALEAKKPDLSTGAASVA